MSEETTHTCTGSDCEHDEHKEEVAAPAADMSSCKACSGEEGAEHTCGM